MERSLIVLILIFFLMTLFISTKYSYFNQILIAPNHKQYSGVRKSLENTSLPTTKTKDKALEPFIRRIKKFTKDKIVISFYTTWFGDRPWGMFAQKANYQKDCGYTFDKCHLSYDVNKWKDADIVFFHGRDMPGIDKLKSMKIEAKKNQLWVYFILENPFNTPPVFKLNDFFELTSSYRYVSDMFYPYGNYDRLSPIEQLHNIKITKNYAEGKDKQIAWMVSHCGTLRDSLAKTFEQHGLSIYVGGGCAKNFKNKLSCPNRDCLDVLKKFKFYFAAENNLCDNYITEKYWRNPFRMEAVPITLGGSNYSDPRLAIPGSFISALDFKTPKDLIDYIKLVDKNDTLYNSYFEWKKYYKVRVEPGGCSIEMNSFCTKLREGIRLRKSPLISDIDRQKECGTQERFYRDWINNKSKAAHHDLSKKNFLIATIFELSFTYIFSLLYL